MLRSEQSLESGKTCDGHCSDWKSIPIIYSPWIEWFPPCGGMACWDLEWSSIHIPAKAARYVKKWYHNTSSVTEIIGQLQWTSLEERRKTARLILLCKISNGLVKIDAADRLITPTRFSRNMYRRSFQIPAVLWYHFFTYLAALRWTISIRCLLFCWYGSQVVQAYSRVGLTSNCYVFSLRFELLMLRFLFKKLKVLLAFLQMLVIDTPRYLADWTCSKKEGKQPD
jgi:hypothetical protein